MRVEDSARGSICVPLRFAYATNCLSVWLPNRAQEKPLELVPTGEYLEGVVGVRCLWLLMCDWWSIELCYLSITNHQKSHYVHKSCSLMLSSNSGEKTVLGEAIKLLREQPERVQTLFGLAPAPPSSSHNMHLWKSPCKVFWLEILLTEWIHLYCTCLFFKKL